MKRKGQEPITAADVERALRVRYAAPAWAFLAQVRNGTGYERRTARASDAIAFSVWPSRGLELHGFEIKVDRGDVRRELFDPEKAEEFIRFCDRWWLAVSDEALVQPGELPPTWGLLILRGGKMECRVEAPKLEAKPLDRLQLAAIFRSVHEANVPAGSVQEAIDKAVEKAQAKFYDRNEQELKSLREAVAEFQKSSGVDISKRWDAGRIGEAVALVLDHRHEPTRAHLERLRQEARETLAMLDAVAAATGVDPAKGRAA